MSKVQGKLKSGNERKLRKEMQCMQGGGEKLERVIILNRVAKEDLIPGKS